jgi:putative N6-adenine-specific DNA methylase
LIATADKHRFFVTCARGTEGALRRELVGLRIGSPKGDSGGVWFDGPLWMGMQVCLHARVAVRVLVQVAVFEADSPDGIYAGTRAVDWTAWLTARSTLAVHATVRDSAVTHSGYAALKVKDAVVDALRDKLGARPDVDPKDPDVGLVLHLAGDRAGLFLDLAGQPLHRRGYRVAMTDAPLKETLAAAVLALGGVAADLPFVDPMAGSGTLAIEHALAARGIAPGLRRRFGFERWPAFAAAMEPAWVRLRDEARAAAEEASAGPARAPIVCADVAPDALGAARLNAAAAGVDGDITFERADVGALDRRWPAGTVCTNPPYGERLAEHEVGAIYRRMAAAFARLGGWAVVVLSGNPLFAHEMQGAPSPSRPARGGGRGRPPPAGARGPSLRPRISHRLFNGPLEVRLLRYEIPAGPSR